MSLDKTIEELKSQLDEEKKKDDAPEEEVIKEEEEVAAEPEKVEEEKPEPEVKEEEKIPAPEEEKPDAAAFARLRREAAADRKRREDIEAELAEMKKPVTEPAAESPIELPEEIKEVLQDHRTVRAEREFMAIESKFKEKTPDYDIISQEYANALAASIRIQNPRLSTSEIAEQTKTTILIKASGFVKQGFNPIEELYHEAKELGFNGKSLKKPQEEAKEEEIKPDMKKLAENRKKSTGMAGSTGKSEGQMTQAAAAKLSIDEWRRLAPSEKKRLMYG